LEALCLKLGRSDFQSLFHIRQLVISHDRFIRLRHALSTPFQKFAKVLAANHGLNGSARAPALTLGASPLMPWCIYEMGY
jgi:hypothetical protein